MNYVQIEQKMLGTTARGVETEADATHVAIALLRSAQQQVTTLQRALAKEKQDKLAIVNELQRKTESVEKLEDAQRRTLLNKRNWRRRALAGIGVSDPEARHQYSRDRNERWHKIVTLILDCESDGDYADLALANAADAAKELKAVVTRVWRERRMWHAELRVPYDLYSMNQNEEVQKRKTLIRSGRLKMQLVPME
jgi:hypothetical protein